MYHPVRTWWPVALAVTLWVGCQSDQSQEGFCDGPADCPVGAVCQHGVCVPGEYRVTGRRDLGLADAGQDVGDLGPADGGQDAAADLGPADGGQDAGGADGGEDLGPADGGQDAGGQIAPLTVGWVSPGPDETVTGTVQVVLRVADDPRIPLRLARFFVDDAPVTAIPTPEPGEIAAPLDTTTLPDGPHTLRAWVQDMVGREGEPAPRRILVANHPGRLEARGDHLGAGASPVGLVGVRYLLPGDPATIGSDVEAMAQAGLNLILVTADLASVEPEENRFDTDRCALTTSLLERAREHHVWVLLRMPGWEDYPYLSTRVSGAAGPAALLWDPKLPAALARRHGNLLERCGWVGRDELAGVVIASGLRLGAPSMAQTRWADWATERYGDQAAMQAAWGPDARFDCQGGPCPPADLCSDQAEGQLTRDYWEFVAQAQARTLSTMASVVRLSDPTVLVAAELDGPADAPRDTLAARCREQGPPLDPGVVGMGLDLLLLAGDPWRGVQVPPGDPAADEAHAADFDLVELGALWAGRSRTTVLLSGFSPDAGSQGSTVQARVWERMFQATTSLGLGGLVGGTWKDHEGQTGLTDPDHAARPALESVSGLAASVTSWSRVPREGMLAVPVDRSVNPGLAILAAQPHYASVRATGEVPEATPCDLPDQVSCEDVAGCRDLCPGQP